MEKDSDLNEIGQFHASGLIAIEDDEPGVENFSLPEIFADGAELDIYWEIKNVAEITGHCLGEKKAGLSPPPVLTHKIQIAERRSCG